ncbi:MAG: GNAT family N-acetyltransferase [Beijerinckiaceae bacterium]
METDKPLPPWPPHETGVTIKIASALSVVPEAEWNACAHPAGSVYNPFNDHRFLSALEESGCVGGRTGWSPAHVLVEDEQGQLLACAPVYLKTHSQGEYVFDHGWADAYERAGGQYYPKIQVSIPFTPATGARLLIRDGIDKEMARASLLAGLKALRAQTKSSSIHVTFLEKAEWEFLGTRDFLQRIDQQFHWFNRGYENFDDFLARLASRKRKLIRRERRDALANGITIHHLTGDALTEPVWDRFFEFYRDTGSRKWGRPYLTRQFFSVISQKMRNHILLVMAERDGHYIAGAINFIGGDTLYGRHWGCIEDHPFLHFEVCYYQAMDFAIARKLARVEAGAQGEHKLLRGYDPVTTYSAHHIADPALRRAVADYLGRERTHVAAAQEELAQLRPFRRDLDSP